MAASQASHAKTNAKRAGIGDPLDGMDDLEATERLRVRRCATLCHPAHGENWRRGDTLGPGRLHRPGTGPPDDMGRPLISYTMSLYFSVSPARRTVLLNSLFVQ